MKCEQLDVWKRSSRLAVNLYNHFKSCDDESFKEQITRNGLSVPGKIAEAMEMASESDRVRCIESAKGASAELITQIYIGIEIGYIDKAEGIKWAKELNEILRMLTVLQTDCVDLDA